MIDDQQFEKIVVSAIRELPEYFRKKMENITIHIEDFPDQNILKNLGFRSPYSLLGVYQGVPLSHRGIHYRNVMPDRIIIFRKPLLHKGRSDQMIKKNIKKVVIHEIGHFFGLSDAELYRIEKNNIQSSKDKA
ncbi:MAG: metallopeptidase family protein [Candidatus Atribacteria bacterium]|nr:metallopeptidase family protein [Candidatus Atribacteria bacterium]